MKIEPTPDFAPTFNEPQPDWVPIDRALYYFSSRQFRTSPEACADTIVAAINLWIEASLILGPRTLIKRDTYRVSRNHHNEVDVETEDASTSINPSSGCITVMCI